MITINKKVPKIKPLIIHHNQLQWTASEIEFIEPFNLDIFSFISCQKDAFHLFYFILSATV